MINALIGLPDISNDVTQTPVVAEDMAPVREMPETALSLPTGGGGMIDTPRVFFPYTPIYPPGPSPIIFPIAPPIGPNPPITPPVTPPVTIPSAPEPAGWAMMTLGFALIGALRRRDARRTTRPSLEPRA